MARPRAEERKQRAASSRVRPLHLADWDKCFNWYDVVLLCSGSQIWVHLNCAVWLPEGWVTGVEDAGGLLQAAAWRFEKICDLCGVDEGAVVKCHKDTCSSVFHPVCATMAAYGMNLTGIAVGADITSSPVCNWCASGMRLVSGLSAFCSRSLKARINIRCGDPTAPLRQCNGLRKDFSIESRHESQRSIGRDVTRPIAPVRFLWVFGPSPITSPAAGDVLAAPGEWACAL